MTTEQKHQREAAVPGRILDFAQVGMWWEITQSTVDTRGEFLEALNVLESGFPGPPPHMHPSAEESYEVVEGSLDVCVDGKWSKLTVGEAITVPAGISHTLKNESGAEVRIINVHRPALGFERFFRRFQALSSSGKMKLPPKDLSSAIYISMLFMEHPREITPVNPPQAVMKLLAFAGKVFRYQLPP